MLVDVSVVIPTYKRVNLLQKCLFALQQQQYKGVFEVIVVSDGEDEQTATLVAQFCNIEGALFMYAALPKKAGPAAARNKGWRAAQGKLILFTDDDTQPAPQWLQTYWNAYKKNNKKELAFTGKVTVSLPKYPTDYERNTAGLETADFVTANCACSKAALQKINGFDEDFTMAWREDSELEFKLMNAGVPVIKVADAMVLHPARKAAWGVSLKEQKKSMFNALLYKKHPRLFRAKIISSPVWNYYVMIFLFLFSLVFFLLKIYLLAGVLFGGWLVLEMVFVVKRLRGNSHSLSHLSEMLVTSLLIPFLSVYWTLYGALKFKVFFL